MILIQFFFYHDTEVGMKNRVNRCVLSPYKHNNIKTQKT